MKAIIILCEFSILRNVSLYQAQFSARICVLRLQIFRVSKKIQKNITYLFLCFTLILLWLPLVHEEQNSSFLLVFTRLYQLGLGLLDGSLVKDSSVNAGDRRYGFDPWVRKIPWRWKWQSTPVFLLGESLGQRSLKGYSPGDPKESDTTEKLSVHVSTHTHTHTHPHTHTHTTQDSVSSIK